MSRKERKNARSAHKIRIGEVNEVIATLSTHARARHAYKCCFFPKAVLFFS